MCFLSLLVPYQLSPSVPAWPRPGPGLALGWGWWWRWWWWRSRRCPVTPGADWSSALAPVLFYFPNWEWMASLLTLSVLSRDRMLQTRSPCAPLIAAAAPGFVIGPTAAEPQISHTDSELITALRGGCQRLRSLDRCWFKTQQPESVSCRAPPAR